MQSNKLIFIEKKKKIQMGYSKEELIQKTSEV